MNRNGLPIIKINIYILFSGGNLHACVHCQVASRHIASMESPFEMDNVYFAEQLCKCYL